MTLTKAQAELLAPAFTPYWGGGQYIPYAPNLKQRVFLCLDDVQEVGYGGAAGGGKSDGLLMGALQYVDVPGYAALILRRTFSALTAPGGLISRAHLWLDHTDARWEAGLRQWVFPSGAILKFGYLQHDKDLYQYQSTEYQYIGFDEATQFTEHQYTFLFSRMRGTTDIGVPWRMRSGTNPGSLGHAWYAPRFRLGSDYKTDPMPPDRAFVPAYIRDNPALNEARYLKSLRQLDPVLFAQLAKGNWDARERGEWFDREKMLLVGLEDVPKLQRVVRFWDMAATEPSVSTNPDWTVGLKLGVDADGGLWLLDVERFQKSPHDSNQRMRMVTQTDGLDVEQVMEQEPGASGKRDIAHMRASVFAGFTFRGVRPSGSKQTRARAVSSRVMAGDMRVVRGSWNAPFFGEVEAFPPADPTIHDDQVDALSGAYQEVTGRRKVGAR